VGEIRPARDDLKVTVAGVKMTPSMGLTAWTSFIKMKDYYMAMGDIVNYLWHLKLHYTRNIEIR
jgi:hypothetical protein